MLLFAFPFFFFLLCTFCNLEHKTVEVLKTCVSVIYSFLVYHERYFTARVQLHVDTRPDFFESINVIPLLATLLFYFRCIESVKL